MCLCVPKLQKNPGKSLALIELAFRVGMMDHIPISQYMNGLLPDRGRGNKENQVGQWG